MSIDSEIKSDKLFIESNHIKNDELYDKSNIILNELFTNILNAYYELYISKSNLSFKTIDNFDNFDLIKQFVFEIIISVLNKYIDELINIYKNNKILLSNFDIDNLLNTSRFNNNIVKLFFKQNDTKKIKLFICWICEQINIYFWN